MLNIDMIYILIKFTKVYTTIKRKRVNLNHVSLTIYYHKIGNDDFVS